MRQLFLALLLCAGLLPAAASAGDFDYTFLEAGASHSTLGGISGGNGYEVTGSFGFPLGFAVDASHEQSSFDSEGPDSLMGTLKARRNSAHLDWHLSVLPYMDILFSVGGTRVELSSGESDSTQGGLDAGVGLRATLPAGFELEAGLRTDDAYVFYVPPLTGDLTAGAGISNDWETAEIVVLRYHVIDPLLISLQYTARSATSGRTVPNTWLLSARWNFL